MTPASGHALPHALPRSDLTEHAVRPVARAPIAETAPRAPTGSRDRSRDGFRNLLEGYALTHFGPFWRFANRAAWLERRLNRLLINTEVTKAETRPHPYSARSPYTSWESLTDRTWNGRYLRANTADDLPAVEAVTELFRRPSGRALLSPKSTYLFPVFAQWFTDGFLRTDDRDRLKNSSNHEIDVCPLYGLRPEDTQALRLRSEARGARGRLKSQRIGSEEYAPFLFEDDGATPKAEFAALETRRCECWRAGRWRSGGPCSPSAATGPIARSITAMLNTLFLREHNRVCGILEQANPAWDDERVFQTARNVVVVLLIKIVVEEYINHISPYHFQFQGRSDQRLEHDLEPQQLDRRGVQPALSVARFGPRHLGLERPRPADRRDHP